MKNKLKHLIELSTNMEHKGKSLLKQGLENYVENVLNLNVINSEIISEYDYYVIIKIKAKSRVNDSTFTFVSDHNDFDKFKLDQHCLILKKIESGNKFIKPDKTYCLKEASNYELHNDKLLTKPLNELILNKNDKLTFAVNLIKDKLENESNYEYIEHTHNLESFFIRIGNSNNENRVHIGLGKSNTIQVSFLRLLTHIEIEFENASKSVIADEIENMANLVHQYVDWNILIDNKHNFSELYDLVNERALFRRPTISMDNLLRMKSEPILSNIIIGEQNSYRQVSLTITYNYKTKLFELTANYLFNNIKYLCNKIEEIDSQIKNIVDVMNNNNL